MGDSRPAHEVGTFSSREDDLHFGETLLLYIREIVRLHGVPVSRVSDRDPRFTAQFWKSFQKAMGTRLTMSTTFHPQTNGKSEMTIQLLEDMLRACILDHKGSREEHLPLVEFAYNNSYQASIQMAPYEALYGRPCRSPLCWTKVGESSIKIRDSRDLHVFRGIAFRVQ